MNKQEASKLSELPPLPVAIVVGASSGIGAAIARQLAQKGFIVTLLAPEHELLEQVCQQINSELQTERAFAYPHDVTQYTGISILFESILRAHRRIDALLYVAGVMPEVHPDEYNFAKDKQMIDINLLGAMAWLAQAATFFDQQGAGHVVGISSVAGERGRVRNPGYCASKAALNTYLEFLRNRLTRKGVHVLTVKPGFVDTTMIRDVSPKFWVISPDQAAKDITAAMRKHKQEIYIPARWGLVMFVLRQIPSFIFRRLTI